MTEAPTEARSVLSSISSAETPGLAARDCITAGRVHTPQLSCIGEERAPDADGFGNGRHREGYFRSRVPVVLATQSIACYRITRTETIAVETANIALALEVIVLGAVAVPVGVGKVHAAARPQHSDDIKFVRKLGVADRPPIGLDIASITARAEEGLRHGQIDAIGRLAGIVEVVIGKRITET